MVKFFGYELVDFYKNKTNSSVEGVTKDGISIILSLEKPCGNEELYSIVTINVNCGKTLTEEAEEDEFLEYINLLY